MNNETPRFGAIVINHPRLASVGRFFFMPSRFLFGSAATILLAIAMSFEQLGSRSDRKEVASCKSKKGSVEIKVLHGDCRVVVPTLGRFKMVFGDPPDLHSQTHCPRVQ